MSSRLPILAGLTALLLIFAVSCSGSNSISESPTSPELSAQQVQTLEAGRYLWAYYEIAVNPEENTFEIIPVRNTEDHWNILKFLEKGPCTNCLKVLGMSTTADGTKLFDVQISHPFASPGLTGFDVRGITMFAGSHTFPIAGLTTPDRHTGDGALVNPDGYTTLYNATTIGEGPGGFQGYFKGKFTPPMTPNALLNGFKRFASAGMANTRNAFYAGNAVLVTYELDMPDSQFIFGYAVDANWAPPIHQPVTNPMVDFGPDANCPEPWKIEVTLTPIGQGLTDQGGKSDLLIDVYDYQGKGSHFPPIIECSDLFNGTLTATWLEDFTGYTKYKVTVENVKIAPQGEYMALLKVEDTANLTAPDYLDLTAYQVLLLEVGEFQVQANQPPVAAASVDDAAPEPGQTIYFTNESTDPDGPDDIIKYEWDFSYNVIDGFQAASEEENPSVSYPDPGTFQVQLRVTDSELHTDLLDTPLTIVVQSGGNLPPVAGASVDNANPQPNQPIQFTNESTDPDGIGDITLYEWDFSFNIIDGFQVGSTEENPSLSYPTPGTYLVQLRVTDTALHTDMLDTPLTITVQGSANEPPIACGDASTYHVDIKIPPIPVQFYDCSFDPNGLADITLYEWDLNGDGIYEKFGQNTSKTYTLAEAGDILVQHRVTDTAMHQDILDEPILIEVNAKPTAEANASEDTVDFGDYVTITSTSFDADGNGAIIEYYWDVNGNGNYGDAEDISGTTEIILTFWQAGLHQIGLKVVDEWGLMDELDAMIQITVIGFDPFCIELIDQWNSANSLYGTRSFKYFQNSINNLGGLDYKAPNGPWNFNLVPASPPAICNWLLPSNSEVSFLNATWPGTDFYFKENAPGSGTVYAPHEFDFDDVDTNNGDLILRGQYDATGVPFLYNNVFEITHPICAGWTDAGSGNGTFSGINFSITWSMSCLGSGPAIFTVNGEQLVLNCLLIRHNMSFIDTEFGYLSFSLLNYQWIDDQGNEVAFMQADNGLSGTNYVGNNYTGTVICRSLQTIS